MIKANAITRNRNSKPGVSPELLPSLLFWFPWFVVDAEVEESFAINKLKIEMTAFLKDYIVYIGNK